MHEPWGSSASGCALSLCVCGGGCVGSASADAVLDVKSTKLSTGSSVEIKASSTSHPLPSSLHRPSTHNTDASPRTYHSSLPHLPHTYLHQRHRKLRRHHSWRLLARIWRVTTRVPTTSGCNCCETARRGWLGCRRLRSFVVGDGEQVPRNLPDALCRLPLLLQLLLLWLVLRSALARV